MSADVVKKRGRPKKIISDPIEIGPPENKKSITRAKSTKAAPKPAKTIPIPIMEAPITPTALKSASTSAATSKPTLKTSASNTSVSSQTLPKYTKLSSKTSGSPETSKILEQVRELSAKSVPPSADAVNFSKPSPTIPSSSISSTSSSSPQSLKASKSPKTPPQSSSSPLSEQPTPIPQKPSLHTGSKLPPKIPLAALNSEIVSNISSRAGARPNTGAAGNLAAGYKSAARRWTAAVVAMPIVLVTSYVLYERLILGEERKVLVRPGLTPVEAPAAEVASERS